MRNEYYKVKALYERYKDHPDFNVARWVSHKEGKVIYELMAGDPESYVECGTANGYSACWAAAGLLDGKKPCCPCILTFDVVDRPKVYDEPDIDLHEDLPFMINSFVEPFDEAMKAGTTANTEAPILYFIDGDHTKDGVLKDWYALEPLLRPIDLVLFHDTATETGVRRAMAEILNTDKGDFEKIDTERGMILLRNYAEGTE